MSDSNQHFGPVTFSVIYKKVKTKLTDNFWVFPLLSFVIAWIWTGHLIGGFIFGLVGFIIVGQIVVNVSEASSSRESFFDNSNVFDGYLAALMAAVMKADGKIVQAEVEFVNRKIKEEYFPGSAAKMINRIKAELDNPAININLYTSKIEQEFTVSEKIHLLHLLVGIAVADKFLSDSENLLLQQITAKIGIPYRTLDGILAMHRFVREQKQNYQRQARPVTLNQLEQAFKILEIAVTATNHEIKKAYKKLAIIHHPDKVAHLGEDMQKTAAEKFKIIVGAYDLICKKKGIV